MPLTNDVVQRILRLTESNHRQQIRWRRHLHQYPEPSYEEFQTTEFIKKAVRKLGLRLLPVRSATGLLAELRLAGKGPVVAIRSDIDALPVGEQTALPFRSKNDGCMHACGHDMHMATVLGVAWVLSRLSDAASGTVRFIFQPAEEKPPGGALPMLESGAVDGVGMIFGLHVDPQLATGRIGLRDGITMAAVVDFDLIIQGRAGHAARPQDAVDAIATACEVVESVQKIVSREIDPTAPVAVTFGQIEGGWARNVIADRVKLVGTARALSTAAARVLPKLIRRTAQAVCRAHGASAKMEIIGEYPLFVNNPRANSILQKAYRQLYPRGRVALTQPVLGGEDFARYLQKVPGSMFRLGIRNPKIKADKPWHSPRFIADERALLTGTAVLSAAVLDFLGGSR